MSVRNVRNAVGTYLLVFLVVVVSGTAGYFGNLLEISAGI
jgi:hypothetical protein